MLKKDEPPVGTCDRSDQVQKIKRGDEQEKHPHKKKKKERKLGL